jgi:hypothetical protein
VDGRFVDRWFVDRWFVDRWQLDGRRLDRRRLDRHELVLARRPRQTHGRSLVASSAQEQRWNPRAAQES